MRLQSVFLSTLMLSTSSAKLSVQVDLGYSKYDGVALSSGITQWLGMRYAAPPVGRLRFTPPQDPPHTEEVQKADTVCDE
jgi:carboxylesterase type B